MGTAPVGARIEALRRCQDAGYVPRVRFSPIIPVKNWREENRAMIRELLTKVEPDIISLSMFGWMDAYKVKRALAAAWALTQTAVAVSTICRDERRQIWQ